MEDMFGEKSERSMEKANELSARPVDSFAPIRISIELSPKEVQAFNILYQVIKPEVVPDMKALGKFLIQGGLDAAFANVRSQVSLEELIKSMPPEILDKLPPGLRKLLEGLNGKDEKGGLGL